MSHIKDAKPEPLTAGTPTPDDALREARADARHWQAQFEAAHWERAEIRQALDASRAETEAARRERDEAHAAYVEESVDLTHVAAERAAIRALAAELAEGLALAKLRFEALAAHDNTMRNGVRPSVGALEAEDIIARARALGIGGEKANV